jgi:photosynthetic reaction center cytochrome c subunit
LKLVDCFFFQEASRLTERIRLSAVFVVATVLAASALGLKQDKPKTPHAATGPVSPADSSAKKAEEQFKNIQVLKGIPAEQLIPTMQFISASLGVECEFCHEPKAFDKDDKKTKQTARKMMEMMFAINKDNFEGHREVTCYSCHRGNAHPQAIPAVATEQAPAAQPQHVEPDATQSEGKENSGPTADQLLEKYVQALGGSPAIDKVTTRVMKGTIDFGGKSLPIDIYCKAPDERISFTHMPEGDSVTAFNGHEGWLGMPGRPIRARCMAVIWTERRSTPTSASQHS